ncbi:MAG: Rv3235 family protein [Micrococcales bacterium]|nr:Rv3235 family protein [Micrococcales bacterium]
MSVVRTTGAPRIRPVPRPDRPAPVASADPPARVLTLAERIVVVRTAAPLWADDPPAPPAADATQVAQTLCGPLVEVCVGARSPSQVARWVAPRVLACLRQRARLSAASTAVYGVPVVRRLVTCDLGPAVEVAATVDDSRRTRAMAMRLEPHHGLWRVTALELA